MRDVIKEIKAIIKVKVFYWEYFNIFYFGNFRLDKEANLTYKLR